MFINTVTTITMGVLDRASTFGKVLGRFTGGGWLSNTLNRPAEELLHSLPAMAIIIAWHCAMPVLFILYAIIRHKKRIKFGVIMKNGQKAEGVVTKIDWKKASNDAYSRITKDRYAEVSYKVNGSGWKFQCPAGALLKDDKICVVYEKDNPKRVLLERDYEEGRKGSIIEKLLAAAGIAVILVITVSLVIVYTAA